MAEPKLRAEDFSITELREYGPLGEAAGTYISLFNYYLEELGFNNKKSKIIMLEGFYGMGKTLLVRRSLLHAAEQYPIALPIYIPIRGLGIEDPRRFEELREKYRLRDPHPITYALMFWRERCENFLGKDLWNIEVRTNETKVTRLDVLAKIIEQNPKDLPMLIKIATELGFIPIVAIDELEGFILRDTRDKEYIRGLQIPIVEEIIVKVYGWLTGRIGGGGLVILASAIGFESDEWLRIPLQELVRYPRSAGLMELLAKFKIPSDEIQRIVTAPSVSDKDIDEVCRKYVSTLPFKNPSVIQTLRASYVKLRYKEEDYKNLFERFNIKVIHRDLLSIFELIGLSIRTAVGIARKMRLLNLDRLEYSTLSKILKEGAEKCYSIDSDLKRQRKIPSHTKAITRVCNLLHEGILAVDNRSVSLLLYYEELSKEERVKLQEDFRKSLCRAFMIQPCDPWNLETIHRIINVITQLRLEWHLIKLVSASNKPEYFVVDEVLLRWALGDPYDSLGNTFDLKNYLEQVIDERKKRRM
ncbi:MAG: hypothetical protein QW245_02500 [Ignisphaera sp.]